MLYCMLILQHKIVFVNNNLSKNDKNISKNESAAFNVAADRSVSGGLLSLYTELLPSLINVVFCNFAEMFRNTL